MMKTMTRGPVRYSPGVLFLCQWPYRALPEQKGRQRHIITVLELVSSLSWHPLFLPILSQKYFMAMDYVSWTQR